MDEDSGRAGSVFISEPRREKVSQGVISHVCLDQFTGGPMDGMLFSEGPLYGAPESWKLDIAVGDDVDEQGFRCLKRAIDDLCQGRLALGAAASRGHGYFAGSAVWQPPLEGGM
ncbi:MAG: hypothetical protein HN348_35430 [Proteobacteria bacterium]|nr:hypothetical protein [Pseudomonadota bacterium]